MSTSIARAPRALLGRGRKPQARKLRDAKDAAYRAHIVEVAERAFAEQGFTDTRMQDIAATAGVSLAKLYEFYPSKDALHRGVLVLRDREMLERSQQRIARVMQVLDSVEHVLLLLETHLHYLLDHPDYLRMQLRQGYAWYSLAASPTREEQQMWDRGVAAIGLVLGWGVKAGFFRPGHPAEQARMILSAQQTRVANWVMDDMRQSHDEVIAQVQADFVRTCCRPAIVVRLLTEDGSGLTDAALRRIAQLRNALKP